MQRQSDTDPSTYAEDFLHFLLEGNVKFAMKGLSKDEFTDAAGSRAAPSAIEESLQEFAGKVMTFIEKGVEHIDSSGEGEYATVRFSIRWTGLMADSFERKTFSGVARIKMKRSPYEGWDVVQASVPGWNAV